MNCRQFFLGLVMAVVCLGGYAESHRDLESDIDAWMKPYDQPGVPGASVLVMRTGMVSIRKGYGLQNLEAKEKASENTNYRLASVSKQFTAMAVLRLVEAGTLSLTESLTDIFSDFPSYGQKIQVRHLLGHTSGLRDYEDLLPGGGQISDADVLSLMKRQSSGDFTPGSRYRYSNGGYCLLAQIVEARSGMQFEEFVREKIFLPLGMLESHVYEKDKVPPISERAYGYTAQGGGFQKTDQSQTSATQGDGGVYTSVVDYEKWLKGMDLILSNDLLSAMFAPGKLNDGSATTYGFGWVVDTYRGLKRHSHTGSTIGFRTAVQSFPEKGASVAVFINRAGATPWEIARQIADRLLFQE